jgi:prepilin-type N-terminal cleavage/methylation domain-containing protein
MKARAQSRGFTLMELLIVVAIIAIIAAVSIPIFAGQLENARAAACAANRRSLKSLVTQAYLTGGMDEVKAECGQNSGLFVCPKGGNIAYYVDAATGACTVACSYHDSQNAADKITPDFLKTVSLYKNGKNQANGNLNTQSRVDSNASDTATMKSHILAAMNQQGIDFGKMNVNSWALINTSSKAVGITDFVWSGYDISGSEYSKVPVMDYHYQDNTYSVGLADVGVPTGYASKYSYNALVPNRAQISKGVAEALGGSKTFSSYAEALAYYNSLFPAKK